MFKIAPDLDPELIDEGRIFSKPRNAEGLAWAEKRLRELGLTVAEESRVKSYVLERDAFVAYADPRGAGRIEFTVFKKPLPKRSRRHRLRLFPRFNLPDGWKHGIRAKFEKQLADAVAKMKAGKI